jgi:hypothetical protein
VDTSDATSGVVKAERLYDSFGNFTFQLRTIVETFSRLIVVSSKAQPLRCGSWPKVVQSAGSAGKMKERTRETTKSVRIREAIVYSDRFIVRELGMNNKLALCLLAIFVAAGCAADLRVDHMTIAGRDLKAMRSQPRGFVLNMAVNTRTA